MNIIDIARLSGTSKSTVSRVLTNNPNVKPETREKILEVMRQYGYRPNAIARGLVQGSLKVIAVVIPDIRNPFYSELISFMEKEFFAQGYQLFLCCTDQDPVKEKIAIDLAAQYNFAGIVIISPMNTDYLKLFRETASCPVLIMNRYLGEEFDSLTTDNFQGGYLAARHLIELGHRRIAVLSGPQEASTHHDRREGFFSAVTAYHAHVPESFQLSGDLDMDSGHQAGNYFLSLGENAPTAVFCTTDLMAIGVMQAYKNAGRSIPDDLSIVGFDDIPFANVQDISLTTIRQPYSDLAAQAVRMLLDRLADRDASPMCAMLDCRLVIRGSSCAYTE